MLVSGLGELHLEILRDRIEIEYGIKSELGRMRVAYRETIGGAVEETLTVEKVIGGHNMYAQLKMLVETTIDDYDMNEFHKQKFDQVDLSENDSAYKMSADSFNLSQNTVEGDSDGMGTLSANQIQFDFENL